MAPIPSLSEASFLRLVVALAHDHGWLAYHCFDSRKTLGHGLPDLILVRPGRLVFAELKSQSGKLRPLQSVWLRLLATIPGITVCLWRSSQWQEIVSMLAASVRERRVAVAVCLSA